MKRSLISIGCDVYFNCANLAGAETDASRIYASLMPADTGDYDCNLSRLLLSPTLAEIRQTLSEVLSEPGEIDTLTVYFAGHGGVKLGTYYFLPKDANPNILSATAFSMSELLNIVSEAAPRQTNVILDSCEAGGIAADIRTFLRPEDLGAAHTVGVTVLGMAARDKYAIETSEGGIGTSALLDCVTGGAFISDTRPTLDLLEIGGKVSDLMQAAGDQKPVLWGLNLFGSRSFSANPNYGKPGGSLRARLGDQRHDAGGAVAKNLPILWRHWEDIADAEWEPLRFINTVSEVLSELSDGEGAQFLDRLLLSVNERASESIDRFRKIEALAATMVSAMPCLGKHLEEVLARWLAYVANEAKLLAMGATTAIRDDKFALLSRSGGIADLFILPLRISRLAAWAGAAVHIELLLGSKPDRDFLRELCKELCEHYPRSMCSMSDTQASHAYILLTALGDRRSREIAETVFGLMFSSAVEHGGRVAAASIEPDRILPFLLSSAINDFSTTRELLARPSELMSVLFRMAAAFKLHAECDYSMIEFDHLPINVFIPTDYAQFGHEIIRDGVNVSYRVGDDIFEIADLERSWPAIDPPSSPTLASLCILAAILMPDRVPWFLRPR